MTTDTIKVFSNTRTGAPAVSNNWGDLTNMLDACLINGYNSIAVSSLTRSSGTATATVAAGHTYVIGDVIFISNATGSAYNGEQIVTNVTNTTISFAVTGSPTTPDSSGTITLKFAPLGFTTVYSGTNKRVYKSADSSSNQALLRVDNSLDAAYTTSYAKYAKVTVCDAMSDINTFTTTTRMPYSSTATTINETGTGSGTTAINGWFKWYHATAWSANTPIAQSTAPATFARRWYLIGNSRMFYIVIYHGTSTSTTPHFYAFGDINSYKSPDGYKTILIAANAPYAANVTATGVVAQSSMNNIAYGMYTYVPPTANGVNGGTIIAGGGGLLKSYTGVGSWVSTIYTSVYTGNTATSTPMYSGYNSSFAASPNPVDYSIAINPIYCVEYVTGATLRGVMPGIYSLLQNSSLTNGTRLSNVTGYSGRTFLFLNVDSGNTTSGTFLGQLAFDITGPW